MRRRSRRTVEDADCSGRQGIPVQVTPLLAYIERCAAENSRPPTLSRSVAQRIGDQFIKRGPLGNTHNCNDNYKHVVLVLALLLVLVLTPTIVTTTTSTSGASWACSPPQQLPSATSTATGCYIFRVARFRVNSGRPRSPYLRAASTLWCSSCTSCGGSQRGSGTRHSVDRRSA